MKRLLLKVIIALLLAAGTAWAGSIEDGYAAFKRGDYAEALKLLRPAALQGDARAQVQLGSMFVLGQGVAVNNAEAVKWYRLAAAQGDAEAQWRLGDMLQEGVASSAPDYAEAVKWYRLAAAQGNAEGQVALGGMYEKGRGVPQDYGRAHMWFNLASASSAGANGVTYAEMRDKVAKQMTPQQIAEAQKMARGCQQRNFKDCD
jgi:uncharacterized protein